MEVLNGVLLRILACVSLLVSRLNEGLVVLFLERSDDLVDSGTVGKLSILSDRRLWNLLLTVLSWIVDQILRCSLCHDKAHPSYPSIGFILPRQTRMSLTIHVHLSPR